MRICVFPLLVPVDSRRVLLGGGVFFFFCCVWGAGGGGVGDFEDEITGRDRSEWFRFRPCALGGRRVVAACLAARVSRAMLFFFFLGGGFPLNFVCLLDEPTVLVCGTVFWIQYN